jgi:hypothetical protein
MQTSLTERQTLGFREDGTTPDWFKALNTRNAEPPTPDTERGTP